ncbi:hypothetical protein EK904_003933 [Melospiza melodia maxima]|nr:hypothetical protein EK904_003933 [Melospiza melodia maxima]
MFSLLFLAHLHLPEHPGLGSNLADIPTICTFLSSGATQVWDAPEDVPYAYKANEWVGYDNEKSFGLKVDWLKKNNFGGAMVWTIDLDDFTGNFCHQGKYPLISTLKRGLGLTVLTSLQLLEVQEELQ